MLLCVDLCFYFTPMPFPHACRVVVLPPTNEFTLSLLTKTSSSLYGNITKFQGVDIEEDMAIELNTTVLVRERFSVPSSWSLTDHVSFKCHYSYFNVSYISTDK